MRNERTKEYFCCLCVCPFHLYANIISECQPHKYTQYIHEFEDTSSWVYEDIIAQFLLFRYFMGNGHSYGAMDLQQQISKTEHTQATTQLMTIF